MGVTKGKEEAKKPWEDGGKKTWMPRMTPKRVPMLRYGQTNFHVFKDALSTECLAKYGNLVKLIELCKYYQEKMPVRDDYKLTNDAEDDKILGVVNLKGWSKAQQDMKQKRPMLYRLIWAYLSPKSMNEVRNEVTYMGYSADKDP